MVDEIERFFRIDDRVLKYMSVLLDKTADIEKIKEEIAAAQSKAEMAKVQAETAEAPSMEEAAGTDEVPTPESEAAESDAAPPA